MKLTINAVQENFVTLENYFDELLQGNDAQDVAAVTVADEVAVVEEVDNVFGRF